jgi:hypothetical protein
MAAPQTLLELLKSSGTKVDYDTMDVEGERLPLLETNYTL